MRQGRGKGGARKKRALKSRGLNVEKWFAGAAIPGDEPDLKMVTLLADSF